MQTADYWIEKLGLEEHPEGGFFKETYKSDESVPQNAIPGRFKGSRFFSTGIYFLLKKGVFSSFHKIKSDEMWHFYEGYSLQIVYINLSHELVTIKLGRDFDNGEVLQAVVPANCWFGSFLPEGSSYALVGCTVSPGFDFEDFEMASRTDLLAQYPQYHEIIQHLTY